MARPPALLMRDVEIHGVGRGDCRVRDGLIEDLGLLDREPDDEVLLGHGGALLPGLADHHLHLAAMAAHDASLDLTGIPRTGIAERIGGATRDAGGWLRVVGYDDVAHGPLDRATLDAWSPTPVRVQHRSGALWVLNSAGLDALGALDHPGVERDATGTATGLLWRADDWLAGRLGPGTPPSLAAIGARLAAYGITAVTEASPDAAPARLAAEAAVSGELPQRLLLLAEEAEDPGHPRVGLGPVKLIAADHDLPDPDELAARIRRAHDAGRPVAVHCVTRAALAITLAALDTAGVRDGDRIEHCAVADRALAKEVVARGLRVVTQPTLVACRGDEYRDRSESADRKALWPYASLLDAGIKVAPSSDAPYGDPDPWACLRAASTRRTPSGRVLGPQERVPAAVALRGLLAPLEDPGGAPRRIEVGGVADLVLLDRPLHVALSTPMADAVRATLIEGRVAYLS